MRTSQTRRRGGAPTGWLLRIVRHRARAQWRLLAVTATVGFVVSTLVSTLALVLHVTETDGVGRAVTQDPRRATVTVTAARPGESVTEVAQQVRDGLTELLAAPVALDVQASSQLYDVDRPTGPDALAYVDRRDRIADSATLVDGEWPTAWSGEGPVPVAAPVVGVRSLGHRLGDTIVLEDRGGQDDVAIQVVGIYEVAYPTREDWGRDRLAGAGYSPTYPVPGTGGSLVTEAVGPFVVPAQTFDAGALTVERAVLRATPDLAGVEAIDLGRLRAVAETLEEELGYRLGSLVGTIDVGAGSLQHLLRDTATGVVVTRAGVSVAAVLLLLVAFAPLLQTARLVCDARAAEHDLMRARGASRGHLTAALVVENGVLGVLAGAAGPPCAPFVLRRLGGPIADTLPTDAAEALRTLPGTAWAAAGAVVVMLVVATLVPLVGAPATFVEGQQARGRTARTATLARLAAELIAVGLAVGAWAQLDQYRGTLVGDGDRLRPDLVLVAGPALLVLAAVLVGVRLLSLVTHLAERGAGRGRGAVLPLVGWELGRRPRPHAIAVLLLALALGATTFGLTQVATWERSQRDQAQFAHPAPAVVVDDGLAGTDAGLLLGTGADAAPVARVQAGLSALSRTAVEQAVEPTATAAGITARVLAADAAARAMLDEGRVGTLGGADVAALAGVPATTGGIDLGPDALGIAATVRIDVRRTVPGVAVALRAVVEDGRGLLTTVGLGSFDLEASRSEVTRLLPDVRVPVAATVQDAADRLAADARHRAHPLRLVGIQAIVLGNDLPYLNEIVHYDATVVLEDLAALRPAQDVTAVDPATWALGGPQLDGARLGVVRDALDLPDARWAGTGAVAGGNASEAPVAHPLWVEVSGNVGDLYRGARLGAVVAWTPAETVPVLLSTRLAQRLGPDVGRVGIDVAGALVRGTPVGVVRRIPTVTDRYAAAVDRTALARALVQAGAEAPLLDEWWVAAPDPVAWAQALPDDVAGRPLAARTTTLPQETAALLEHPMRASVPLVLWLLALGGAAVATVGFAVHTVVSVRERGLELAQLRAVGLTRGRLTTVLGLEVALLAVVGVGLGLGVGTAVTGQVTRLLVTGADGGPPVPGVLLAPAQGLEWVAVVLVAVVAALAAGIALAQRAANPAVLLRAGETR